MKGENEDEKSHGKKTSILLPSGKKIHNNRAFSRDFDHCNSRRHAAARTEYGKGKSTCNIMYWKNQTACHGSQSVCAGI